MYNIIFGYNRAVYLLAPMICEVVPDAEFTRFRDCFLSDDEKHILVLTRTGGFNRKNYSEEMKKIKEKVEYRSDRDYIEFDSTYLICEFSVPEEWKEDFQTIISGNLRPLTKEYIAKAKKVYKNIELKNPGVVEKLLNIGCSKESLKMKTKEEMMTILEESAKGLAGKTQISDLIESISK